MHRRHIVPVSSLSLVLSRTARVLLSRRAACCNEQTTERERDNEREPTWIFFGQEPKKILFHSHLYSQPSCSISHFPPPLQILPFTEETWKFHRVIICLTLTRVCLSRLKESRDVYHPTPPPLITLLIVIYLSSFHLQLSKLNCT